MPIKLSLTHEEIAELIGTSRETVTRTLSEFKNQQLVALQGSTLMISNRPGLEAIGCQEYVAEVPGSRITGQVPRAT